MNRYHVTIKHPFDRMVAGQKAILGEVGYKRVIAWKPEYIALDFVELATGGFTDAQGKPLKGNPLAPQDRSAEAVHTR